MTPPTTPSVSVIVPVYNDPAGLRACLAALERQTYPRECFEVIAVDNGSDEPVDTVVADFPGVRLAVESRPGPYAARNTGIALARGDVLAFTDADCVPAPTWIAHGVREIVSAAGCELVAGRIEQSFCAPTRPTAVELWAGLNCFDQRRNVDVGRFGATGNMFVLRDVVEQVGVFPEVLSGGDVILGRRISAAGHRLRYADDACVVHPAPRSYRHAFWRAIRFVRRNREFAALEIPEAPGLPHYVTVDLAAFVRLVRTTWRDGRVSRTWDRLRVTGVVLFLHCVATVEHWRLRLGRAPRNRRTGNPGAASARVDSGTGLDAAPQCGRRRGAPR
jgi:glycosyltransferase involved in cell wall biosynthesis